MRPIFLRHTDGYVLTPDVLVDMMTGAPFPQLKDIT